MKEEARSDPPHPNVPDLLAPISPAMNAVWTKMRSAKGALRVIVSVAESHTPSLHVDDLLGSLRSELKRKTAHLLLVMLRTPATHAARGQ